MCEKIFETLFQEIGEIDLNGKIFAGAKNQNQTLSRKFREICSELGFDDLTVHSLRHTFSTRADKYKVGAFAQKELLGHSKLNMTGRYTHVSKETLKESLSTFEQQIQRKSNN